MRTDTARMLVQKAIRSGYLEIEHLIERLKAETSLPPEEWRIIIGVRLIKKIRKHKDGWPNDYESVIDRLLTEISDREVPRFLVELERQWQRSLERQENGELLAAEGRAARSETTAANDRIIVSLYRSIRPSFSPGRKGNSEAIKVVADRHKQRTGRDNPVHTKTIRNALKRAGVPCK